MKNFFSISSNSEESPFKKYITKTLSDTNTAAVDHLQDEATLIEKKYSRISLVMILCYLLIAFPVFIILVMCANYLKWMKINMWSLYVCLGVTALAVGGVILLNVLKKKIRKSNKVQDLNKRIEEQNAINEQELGVTEPNYMIDIFMPDTAKDENGNEIIQSGNFHTCLNVPVKVYKDESNFNILNVDTVISVPLTAFTKIVNQDKRITFSEWNKEVSYKDAEYKDYKIISSSNGLSVKGYSKVQFKISDDEEYEIIVPDYDIDKVKSLLGM